MTHRGTILVVDDTAESLTLVFRLLTQAGYLVRPADSGELALAAVATTSPELILLDIRMPGMDGFEVCRQLKASEASRDIPVLFLSAVSETAERVEGLRLGAVDFITKPFQAEELLARVHTHLELHRLRLLLETKVESQEEDLREINAELRKELAKRERLEVEREKLQQQNRQLQKSEGLARMACGISDHFNNRLHAVILNLELARQFLPLDAESTELLTEAEKSARSAAELSRIMVTYLGRARCQRRRVDLSEACLAHLPALQAAAGKTGTLESDIPVPGPAVNADESQIGQALVHLVTNASEALGEREKTLRLTLKQVPAEDIPTVNRVPIDWKPEASAYACIEVADTGSGIPTATIEKLFDPFFSTKASGRGLGLPVVLGIARAHSGAVQVETQPGQGSAFRLLLPMVLEPLPPHTAKIPRVPNDDTSATLLLVDDDPMVLQSTADALTHLRYHVLTARDGVESLEVFRQHRDQIHCVLCDVTMPPLDGWETLAALRRLAPRIPVIFTSGYTEAEVMEGDHPERPQAFLGKPYGLAALLKAIQQALASNATSAATRPQG